MFPCPIDSSCLLFCLFCATYKIFDREPRSDRGLKTWFFVVVVVGGGGVGVVGDGQLSIL